MNLSAILACEAATSTDLVSTDGVAIVTAEADNSLPKKLRLFIQANTKIK